MLENKQCIQVKNVSIGQGQPVMIAGPCSIESRQHILDEAAQLKRLGVDILRGGAFKPRTSPDAFQGLGVEGLKYMREAGDRYDLPIITEVMSEEMVEMVASYADILQIGSRNMYNYALLRKVGQMDKPVMLKRGLQATLYEWEMAAKYIEKEGNDQIIFCERGLRSFETETRNMLDLAGATLLRQRTPHPVIIDPSHGTGRRSLILPMTKASLALDMDGVMIEVHENPDEALSDGAQTLDYEAFAAVMKEWTKACK